MHRHRPTCSTTALSLFGPVHISRSLSLIFAAFCSSLVKDLLNWLPPRRLACLTALGALDHGLLELVGHLPPLADLGVLPHSLHIARVVIADVFEGCEKDVCLVVVEYAVCIRRSDERC